MSGENAFGAELNTATSPASGIATCTWIWGAWHCGQKGRPSSTVVPHCWQGCSTSLKLAHNGPGGQDNDSMTQSLNDSMLRIRWCHPCLCAYAHRPAQSATHDHWA